MTAQQRFQILLSMCICRLKTLCLFQDVRWSGASADANDSLALLRARLVSCTQDSLVFSAIEDEVYFATRVVHPVRKLRPIPTCMISVSRASHAQADGFPLANSGRYSVWWPCLPLLETAGWNSFKHYVASATFRHYMVGLLVRSPGYRG